jgi:hypothetical protein
LIVQQAIGEHFDSPPINAVSDETNSNFLLEVLCVLGPQTLPWFYSSMSHTRFLKLADQFGLKKLTGNVELTHIFEERVAHSPTCGGNDRSSFAQFLNFMAAERPLFEAPMARPEPNIVPLKGFFPRDETLSSLSADAQKWVTLAAENRGVSRGPKHYGEYSSPNWRAEPPEKTFAFPQQTQSDPIKTPPPLYKPAPPPTEPAPPIKVSTKQTNPLTITGASSASKQDSIAKVTAGQTPTVPGGGGFTTGRSDRASKPNAGSTPTVWAGGGFTPGQPNATPSQGTTAIQKTGGISIQRPMTTPLDLKSNNPKSSGKP